MAKKRKAPSADQVAWIKDLPEGGGAWGRGIITTVEEMDQGLAPLRKERDALDEKISTRESIMKDAVKRADREARGLFNEGQIKEAKEMAAMRAESDQEPEPEQKAKPEPEQKAKPEPEKGEGKGKSGKSQPRA